MKTKERKITPPAKRRITEALQDHFSFSEQLMNEIVETICMAIERLAETGIEITKVVK